MDLKSMLNTSESSVQKQPPPPPPPPRLHTPQSSLDRSSDRPASYDVLSDRPSSYPPSAHVLDSRSQPGGYFSFQSPQRNSASTPSTGAQSIYAPSPGPHGLQYTPRDSAPAQSPYPPHYVPSPSSAGPPPTTPGSTQYYHGPNQTSAFGASYAPTAIAPRPLTRDDMSHANGLSQGAPRQMSPPAYTHQPPVTPLGPPAAYLRPSPQAQRPSSQGYDHLRRSSVSSVGSSQSRDYTAYPVPHQDPPKMGSMQRTYIGEEERQREREQSMESVSPKTIPRPTPQRQTSSYSQEPPDTQPPAPLHQLHLTSGHGRMFADKILEEHTNGAASHPSSQFSENATQLNPVSGPVPAPRSIDSLTPQSAHSSLPAQPSPSVNKQSSLKRSNSTFSTPSSAVPPRKRPRRGEIPFFAQSARRGRPIRFDKRGPAPRPPRKSPAPRPEAEVPAMPNGQSSMQDREETFEPLDPRFDPTITSTVPYEDLVRQICDWVATHLARATEPYEGAHFEIEAKLGAIVDQETNQRITPPVLSESILNKSMFGSIRFASTMDQNQHKHLNEFLNGVLQQSLVEAHTKPNREVLYYKRERQLDEFYELNPEGRKALPQSLTHWLKMSRYAPKVRKTTDLGPDGLVTQILKIRIADLEVYNPQCAFDYRISLSLEAAVEPEPQHLVPAQADDLDRQKDRISYRHMNNQIDLTQITYPGTTKKEHELEVEISQKRLKHEFALLRNREPSNYEELITSFINNVRILCRAGTIGP